MLFGFLIVVVAAGGCFQFAVQFWNLFPTNPFNRLLTVGGPRWRVGTGLPTSERALADGKRAGVFFCQDVPRTDRSFLLLSHR